LRSRLDDGNAVLNPICISYMHHSSILPIHADPITKIQNTSMQRQAANNAQTNSTADTKQINKQNTALRVQTCHGRGIANLAAPRTHNTPKVRRNPTILCPASSHAYALPRHWLLIRPLKFDSKGGARRVAQIQSKLRIRRAATMLSLYRQGTVIRPKRRFSARRWWRTQGLPAGMKLSTI